MHLDLIRWKTTLINRHAYKFIYVLFYNFICNFLSQTFSSPTNRDDFRDHSSLLERRRRTVRSCLLKWNVHLRYSHWRVGKQRKSLCPNEKRKKENRENVKENEKSGKTLSELFRSLLRTQWNWQTLVCVWERGREFPGVQEGVEFPDESFIWNCNVDVGVSFQQMMISRIHKWQLFQFGMEIFRL